MPEWVQMRAWPVMTQQAPNPDKILVTTGEQFGQMLAELARSKFLVFDFETTGLAWYHKARACGIALGYRRDDGRVRAWYVPFRHRTGEAQLDFNLISGPLKTLLECDIPKTGHNLKFDLHIATREGWRVGGQLHDTMIDARLFDENRLAGLKVRAVSDLQWPDAASSEHEVDLWIADLARTRKLSVTDYLAAFGYSEVPIGVLGHYACTDIEQTAGLQQFYEYNRVPERYARVWRTEMDLVRALHDMEESGLPVDVPYVEQLAARVKADKARLESELRLTLNGQLINMGSDDQLRRYLMGVLRVPLTETTKKGELSVASDTLQPFVAQWPVLSKIIQWRDADYIENGYTTSMLARLDANRVLHSDFQSVGTVTGRMSCHEPNFQNMGKDDDDRAVAFCGKHLKNGGIDPYSIRRCFCVRHPKMPRLFFDYSQIELRVLAFFSRDPILVQAYLTGEDIHSRTAKEVWGNDDKPARNKAKILNFGLTYGMTEYGFARNTGMVVEEARLYMDRFFQRYAGIRPFTRGFIDWSVKQGCRMVNPFGRGRHIPGLVSTDEKIRSKSERRLMSSAISGTAADLAKEALVRVHKYLKDARLTACMVNVVHDEFQIDLAVEHLAEAVPEIKRLMESFPELQPIPIIASAEYTTTSWADKKALPTI